jgi:DNA-binding transcriptional MocR family regulator
MAAADKIEKYLKSRKTPLSPKQIAEYFMYARATVSQALNELEQAGRVTRTPQNTWHINRSRPVAVPEVAPPVVVEPVVDPVVEPDEPVQPRRPVRNLWPAEPVPEDFLEPVQPHDPRRGTYNRPMVNSYPHARGYDD